ncbi:ATP-binding protein [Pseudomonas sp. MAG002Y]|uniref:ATP-binding protein n=1 Tax=Pseudomonas sp. MAG002Y TaxID=2678690 RepID=UPI001C6091AA|nr:ATP-binding protein [Pseudomonas sp. MAG002Y]MBW5414718.1 response regulator [Pseudomonas sp. MAG002Y]
MQQKKETLFDRLQQWVLRHEWPTPLRYAVAGAAVIVSAGVRLALPVLGLPYLLFIPLLMIIGFTLGLGPGLFATVVAALAAAYLFVSTPFTFDLDLLQWAANALFILVNFGIVAVCAALRKNLIRLNDLMDTLERRVEERTRERDQIWQTTPDLVCTTNAAGYFVSLNPAWAKTLGWSDQEMHSKPFSEFVHPDDVERTAQALHMLQRGDTVFRFENRYRHKNGTYHWLSWNAVARGDQIYATVRDISPEKEQSEALNRAEELLRHSQKMEAVGQLTGGIAHDFNNLLTGISGSLEMIQMRVAQGRATDIDRYITAAQTAASRAASLTHRLLAFSRRQTLDPKPTQANTLIESMQDLIDRTVGPEITVTTSLSSDLWSTLCDPNQLESALLNLCINARDAMPDGGQLTIRTANIWVDERDAHEQDMLSGQYVAIAVMDTGIGMTPEIVARAFDPFFTTKPIGMGTGLGLSMIYGFAKQSGGQARIYSEAGKGTTVWIYLPRHLEESKPEPQQTELMRAPRASTGETVLVVDDEPMVRLLITEVLEELGYAAIEAADGASGLKILLSDTHLDLLISDVGLPGGMNGRQMADAARQARPDLKILFITGYAENAAVGNGNLEAGMHVMTKPFPMELLASRIKEIILED